MDVEAASRRIEYLLDELAETDPRAAELAESLVTELVGLYGAGIERILARLAPAAPGAMDELVEDPFVAGLLVLHDLHPDDVGARVEAALDTVRPYLASHGGGVALLGVADGVVRLRLEGSCDGCSASMVTLRSAVEEAVRVAAPEVERIEAEEPTAPLHPPPVPVAAQAPANGTAGGLIPAESLLVRPSSGPAAGRRR